MALKEKINNDLKAALLSGNRFDADVLRGLKAAILNEEVAQGQRDAGLADEAIEKLVAKEMKKRKESATIYEGAGRQELADNENAEAKVLSQYLPKQMTEEEIKQAVEKIVAELGATDVKQMGQVIGAAKSQLGNAADGALIAKIVKEILI